MRILVVDDDPLLRQLLRAHLTRVGHEVLTMADGRSAWKLLQREPIRLVITDWMMPGLDGLELTRRIRLADFPGYVYVILLTARDDKADIVSGLKAGADDYLTKPFDPGELCARVAIGERILDLETRLREARDQLQELATHDSLTGLLNRRAIYDHAEEELARARREARPMSLVLLDVDHFKAVNDQHGHLVGDQALRLIADTIVQNIRSYDKAGRWGGEEFLLVLPRTTLSEAVAVAERVRAGVAASQLPLSDGGCLQLRASLGVANTSPEIPWDLDTLLRQADQALYCAKRKGRNRVCWFDTQRKERAESKSPR